VTETKTLKFRRQFAGSYFAQDATREYAIYRDGKVWMLRIRAMIETAGVRHSIGQPNLYLGSHETKNLAVLIANAYSALGDDFDSNAFGGRRRSTEAIKRGYAAEREAWTS
jgi:hypothetical protein